MGKNKNINNNPVCTPLARRTSNIEPLEGATATIASIRTGWRNWVEAEICSWTSIVFVTLNFKMKTMTDNGQLLNLNELTAKAEVKKFGNNVDKAVFGKNKVRRFNTRIQRIPFLEYGADRGWHCHLIIERPQGMSEFEFTQIVKQSWSASDWSAGRPDIRDGDANLPAYLVKFRSKQAFEEWGDTIILEAAFTHAKYPITRP
jgi:hypothetical protein